MKKILTTLIGLSSLQFAPLLAKTSLDDICYSYGYNPPLYEPWCGLSGHIDFLYFRPDVRYTDTSQLDLNISAVSSNKYSSTIEKQRLRFDFDAGWRIGINYTIPDYYTIDLSFTHFDTEKRLNLFGNQKNIGNKGAINTLPISISIIDDLSSLKNHANIQFNELNLTLSREFLIGPCLTLNPYFGLKSYFIHYNNDFIEKYNTIEQYVSTLQYSNKFSAVGLQGGLKTYWNIYCNLGLEAYGGLALLYGRTKVLEKFTFSTVTNEDFNYNFDEVNFAFDGGLALRWIERINYNQGLLSFRIGWEAHYVSDQNRFLTIPQDQTLQGANVKTISGTSGDVLEYPLTLQGLIVGISVEI